MQAENQHMVLLYCSVTLPWPFCGFFYHLAVHLAMGLLDHYDPMGSGSNSNRFLHG
jgi:hypothetical protein